MCFVGSSTDAHRNNERLKDMSEHWTDGFEHASVTDENREAFNTHMAKFPTQADAVADGFGLAKLKGVAFKFPDSMDKLPDDASRADFTTQANKLLGREFSADIAGLSDMDMKLGSTSDKPIDDIAANALKQMVVDKVIDKKQAQALVEFHNKSVGVATTANTAAVAAAEQKASTEHAAAVTACNAALVAHPDFGTQEKVDEQTVLLHRALLNNVKCAADEAADLANFMKDGEGATNATLRRVLLSQLAPLAAEAGSHAGEGGNEQPGEKPLTEQLPETGKALGWTK